MLSYWLIPIVFAGFSLFFAILVVNDYLRSINKTNPARKAWLRLSIIFVSMSIGLSFLYVIL